LGGEEWVVSLDRPQVIGRAFAIAREHGLAGLSMRRIAGDLGVVPGTLYSYVASKQDLVAAVAEQILATAPTQISGDDPRTAAHDLRAALLLVRDGAEIVSFALALRPDGLEPLRRVEASFAATETAEHAKWAAKTLIYYVLGAVAEEQNHDELVRAGALPADAPASNTDESFAFGIDVILAGVQTARA
jgi:AcrR family transcriptional regulator